jgi:ubiquinol-cytochrome c reductase cytochrome b subunit
LQILIIGQTRTKSDKRIGPHDFEVLSFIFGAILSDAQAERHGNGTRIVLQQESSNMEFLTWYNNFLTVRGYSSFNTKIQSRLGANGLRRFYSKSATWTYTSFNWVHECFYKDSVKFVPSCLSTYLTPLALAIWIMGNGSAVSSGCKLSTNSFTKEDCERICVILKDLYNIRASVNSAGINGQWVIYIWKESMPNLVFLVKQYMVPSMYYKLHIK